MQEAEEEATRGAALLLTALAQQEAEEERKRNSFSVGPAPMASASSPEGTATSSTPTEQRSPIHKSSRRGSGNSFSLIGSLRQPPSSPYRLVQASPFAHWMVENSDDDLRTLAKHFTVHHFSEGEALPESPFVLVASGLVNVYTDTGAHEPVTHGRGSFIVSVSAALARLPY